MNRPPLGDKAGGIPRVALTCPRLGTRLGFRGSPAISRPSRPRNRGRVGLPRQFEAALSGGDDSRFDFRVLPTEKTNVPVESSSRRGGREPLHSFGRDYPRVPTLGLRRRRTGRLRSRQRRRCTMLRSRSPVRSGKSRRRWPARPRRQIRCFLRRGFSRTNCGARTSRSSSRIPSAIRHVTARRRPTYRIERSM